MKNQYRIKQQQKIAKYPNIRQLKHKVRKMRKSETWGKHRCNKEAGGTNELEMSKEFHRQKK